MKKLIALTIVALALACGRPSTSDRFSFDGTGDPEIPEGNIVLGKYAGTVELSKYRSNRAAWANLFNTGNLNLQLTAGIFNSAAVEGMGALQLLALYSQPPIKPGAPNANRLGQGGAPPECYIDTGKFAVLGGNIDTVDVGGRFRVEWLGGGTGNRQNVERDPDDAYENPQADLIFYIGQDGLIPSDEDVEITWEGGTLGFRGYEIAPIRDDSNPDVLNYPADLFGPGGSPFLRINGVLNTSGEIAPAADYLIEWEPTTNSQHLVGMHIIVQLYGPADLGEPGSPANFDIPWFNEIAELVCLVEDDDGDYEIPQAALDALLTVARTTQGYANANEDVNEDGVCEPFGPPFPGQPPEGEDGNLDGDCDDKIYGAALFVNRRTENFFDATLNDGPVPIYISGNETQIFKMLWAPTE